MSVSLAKNAHDVLMSELRHDVNVNKTADIINLRRNVSWIDRYKGGVEYMPELIQDVAKNDLNAFRVYLALTV